MRGAQVMLCSGKRTKLYSKALEVVAEGITPPPRDHQDFREFCMKVPSECRVTPG